MKKKILIALIIIVTLILIGGLLGFRYYQVQGVRKQVLSALEKDLEFCEIIKDKILFNKGEFWLICNGRPFYAVYEKGKVNYELNGWGFLRKQPELLSELKDNSCRLYQATESQILSFICKDEYVKKYKYSVPDFGLTKLEEELFLNQIFRDLWRTKIFPCEIKNTIGVDWQGESFVKLNMECQGEDSVVYFNLDKLYFTLPVVVGEDFSDEEKIRLSVALLNLHFCELQNIRGSKDSERKRFSVNLDCPNTGKLLIDYDLKTGRARFLLERGEFTNFFSLLDKYSFPFLKEARLKHVITYWNDTSQYDYYLVGNQIVIAEGLKQSDVISETYLRNEFLTQ